MKNLRSKSCVFDSLVWPANLSDENESIAMLGRSACESVPRAIETWMAPPDFSAIEAKLQKIRGQTKKDYAFGMFVAEAIPIDGTYKNKTTNANFNFLSMCRPDTQGFWGPGSCLPDYASAEYQAYVLQIVGDAFDHGIQDILLGQVDAMDPTHTHTKEITDAIRALAERKHVQFILGGQTGLYTESSYLRLFDYMIGPSRIAPSGEFFAGDKCLATQDGHYTCDQLEWDPNHAYVNSAKNIIMEFDWYQQDDDIHRFARLTPAYRKKALIDARKRFIREPTADGKAGFGMIMPFNIPLNAGLTLNGIRSGCSVVSEWVYSPSNAYGCKDEDTINALLRGETLPDPDPRPANQIVAHNLVLNLYGAILVRAPLSESPPDEAGFNWWFNSIMDGSKTCKQAIDDFVWSYNQTQPDPNYKKTTDKFLPLCN